MSRSLEHQMMSAIFASAFFATRCNEDLKTLLLRVGIAYNTIMNSLNVVLDTNILVSALRSNRGASYKLLALLIDDIYTPNISVPLFLEYESVIKRPSIADHLTAKEIDDILNFILSKSRARSIYFLWRPFLKDPKDDLVLEVAVESNSEFIITHNIKDFKGVEKFGIQVLGPKQFLIDRGILK